NNPQTGFMTAVLVIWAAILWGGALGCQTECGAGTHEERGECVPDLAVSCTGPGLELTDGQCRVNTSVCAAGSVWDPDAGVCVGAVDNPIPDGGTDDAESDADQAVAACGSTSPEGTICVSGVLENWATGDIVTTKLELLLDDLSLRSVFPEKEPFGIVGVESDGTFAFESVPISSEEGPLGTMILLADEAPGSMTDEWQRTLAGIEQPVQDGAVYPDQVAVAVPAELVEGWDILLGLSDYMRLGVEGFLLARVVVSDGNGGLVPAQGAVVQNTNPGQDSVIERYYLTDDLMDFRQEETTGASGAVLLVGAPIGQYGATLDEVTFRPTLGGAFTGLAVTITIIGE
ncbi:MAG: hypothetical protein AAFS10_09255, partial [Myxococcota bacterium]